MKKIKFVSDPLTSVMAIVFNLIFVLSDLVFLFSEEKEIKNLGIFFIILLIIVDIAAVPRWISFFVLTNKEILLYIPYKKTIKKTYDDFPFCNIGFYSQNTKGVIGHNRYFMVLSQEKLGEELQNINLICNSEKIIKIKFNKKNCNLLLSILPDEKRTILETQLRRTEGQGTVLCPEADMTDRD